MSLLLYFTSAFFRLHSKLSCTRIAEDEYGREVKKAPPERALSVATDGSFASITAILCVKASHSLNLQLVVIVLKHRLLCFEQLYQSCDLLRINAAFDEHPVLGVFREASSQPLLFALLKFRGWSRHGLLY